MKALEQLRAAWGKAIEWLSGIGKDKLLHFVAGSLISSIFAAIPFMAPYAWAVGCAAGLLKEVIDMGAGGLFDGKDMLATFVGAFTAQLFIWVYLVIF